MACPLMVAREDLGRKRHAVGHQELEPHQVEAGDELGDGMLDLEPGVDLQEGEAPVGEDEELDGAGVDVADGARRGHRRRPQLGAPLRGDDRGRALLDDLLVAALDRALALEEMHHGAVRVTEDLHFDVAGASHVGLDEHGPVTEGGARFALGGRHGVGERVGALHHAHAPATPARGGLHEDGPTQRGGGVGDRTRQLAPRGDLHGGEHRHARGRHGGLGVELRAHGLDDLGWGAHEDEPRRHTGPGEPGVFGQEPVAGVHGIGSAAQGGTDDGVDVEIGVGRGGAGQAHELVGFGHVGRVEVGVRAHRHTADAERVRSAHDAPGDLAPVGDEQLLDHGATVTSANALATVTSANTVTCGTRRSRACRGWGCCGSPRGTCRARAGCRGGR